MHATVKLGLGFLLHRWQRFVCDFVIVLYRNCDHSKLVLASNLEYFENHRWLSDERNVITLRLTDRAFV